MCMISITLHEAITPALLKQSKKVPKCIFTHMIINTSPMHIRHNTELDTTCVVSAPYETI